MANDNLFDDVRVAAQRDVERMIELIATADKRVRDRNLPSGFLHLMTYLAESDKLSLLAYMLVAYEAGRIESSSIAEIERAHRKLDS